MTIYLARANARRHRNAQGQFDSVETHSFAERFWEKVDKNGPTPMPSLGPCWMWTAAIDPDTGYGRIGRGGRTVNAHKAGWELTNGPVPAGLHLDHLCRTKACVRPDHLEPIEPAENTRRGLAGQPNVKCSRGHDLLEGNVYTLRNGRRICRTCALARQHRYQPHRVRRR